MKKLKANELASAQKEAKTMIDENGYINNASSSTKKDTAVRKFDGGEKIMLLTDATGQPIRAHRFKDDDPNEVQLSFAFMIVLTDGEGNSLGVERFQLSQYKQRQGILDGILWSRDVNNWFFHVWKTFEKLPLHKREEEIFKHIMPFHYIVRVNILKGVNSQRYDYCFHILDDNDKPLMTISEMIEYAKSKIQ